MNALKRVSCLALISSIFYTGAVAADAPHQHHHHGKLEVDARQPLPQVSVLAAKDSMSGWNIQVKTQNFQFAPERVNSSAISGEGHAHIFVDGIKVARLYAPWFHLPQQKSGKHLIRVTLNANTHEELSVGGAVLAAETTIIEQ